MKESKGENRYPKKKKKKNPNHHPKKKIKIGSDQNGNGPYKLHLKGKYSKSVQM